MNSKRKCSCGCGNFERRELMLITPSNLAFIDPGHAAAYAQRNYRKNQHSIAKRAKSIEKAFQDRKKAHRQNSLPHQHDLTQMVFNKMIRLLDRGKKCPTCGERLVDGLYDAGHVRTVASCPQLRYEPRACFGQCRRCNGSGTIRKRTRKPQEVVSELFKAWILETFGWQRHAWIYGPHASPNWICADLIEMRKVFAAECRILEKGGEPSRDWRQIQQQDSRLSGRAEDERDVA